ncbi:hypothetical protein [Campylobacter sp.]|nr:hypothetical protein [Campylobacter sp.]MCI7237369.1 hypothetical protein [Campylobacter sp.]
MPLNIALSLAFGFGFCGKYDLMQPFCQKLTSPQKAQTNSANDAIIALTP